MTRTNRRTLRALMGLAVVGGLAVGFATGAWSPTATAEEGRLSEAADPGSGVFIGTDENGNFQGALEDAVAQAVAAAGCCDIRVSYTVLETTGQVGGIFYLNRASVKIHAEW